MPFPYEVVLAQALLATVHGPSADVERRISITNRYGEAVDVVHRVAIPEDAHVTWVSGGEPVPRGRALPSMSYGGAAHGPVEVSLEAPGAVLVKVATLCPGQRAEVSLGIWHLTGRNGWQELMVPEGHDAEIVLEDAVRQLRVADLDVSIVDDEGGRQIRVAPGAKGLLRWRARHRTAAPPAPPTLISASTSAHIVPSTGPGCGPAQRTLEAAWTPPVTYQRPPIPEPLDVVGELVSPGCVLVAGPRPGFNPLIRLRRSFHDPEPAPVAIDERPVASARPELTSTGSVATQHALRRRLARIHGCGALPSGLHLELRHMEGHVTDVLVGSDDPSQVSCVAKRVQRWRIPADAPADLLVVAP